MLPAGARGQPGLQTLGASLQAQGANVGALGFGGGSGRARCASVALDGAGPGPSSPSWIAAALERVRRVLLSWG